MLLGRREREPGTVFRGTYRIVRVLGRGGMGIVYLAEHLLLGEARALKFLAPELATNPGAVQRFLREAQKAAKIGLHQPNIVKTLDLGQDEDGSFFICMEYVDGPSLAALMDQAPRGLPVERALAIVRGIAHGLEAAHAKGMVHRDIKPGNVLLARTEEGEEVAKIADFGIVTGAEEESQLTRTGLQPLTPEYASPEQWRGVIPGHELDGRTDLYALGCVFFEMLTGTVPFHGASADDLRDQHVNAQPPAPSLLQPELARYVGLDAVVLRLLAKAREHRPPNVHAFLEELNGVAVGVRPDPVRPQAEGGSNSSQRHAMAAGQARQGSRTVLKAAAVILLVALMGWGIWYAVVQHNAAGQDSVGQDSGQNVPAQTIAAAAHDSGVPGNSTAAQKPPLTPNATPSAEKPDKSGNANNLDEITRQGADYYTHDQYALAKPLLEKSCEAGRADSCDRLGNMYQLSWGVAQDYKLAVSLFTYACDKGYASGCSDLGWMYEHELGVARDYYRAANLYETACTGGTAYGCAYLGHLYRVGTGVAKDTERARTLLKKGCDMGSQQGCDELKAMQ
jgi:TPR repeat protein